MLVDTPSNNDRDIHRDELKAGSEAPSEKSSRQSAGPPLGKQSNTVLSPPALAKVFAYNADDQRPAVPDSAQHARGRPGAQRAWVGVPDARDWKSIFKGVFVLAIYHTVAHFILHNYFCERFSAYGAVLQGAMERGSKELLSGASKG